VNGPAIAKSDGQFLPSWETVELLGLCNGSRITLTEQPSPLFPLSYPPIQLADGTLVVFPEEPPSFPIELTFPVASQEDRIELARQLKQNPAVFDEVVQFARGKIVDEAHAQALLQEREAIRERLGLENANDGAIPQEAEILTPDQREAVRRLTAQFPRADAQFIVEIYQSVDYDEEKAREALGGGS
jgi:hypothetical protein